MNLTYVIFSGEGSSLLGFTSHYYCCANNGKYLKYVIDGRGGINCKFYGAAQKLLALTFCLDICLSKAELGCHLT